MITLKRVLQINAVSSALAGAGLTFGSPYLATLFGISNSTAIAGVGVFLMAFALLVFSEGGRSHHRIKMVLLIITLDVLWVLDSILIILFRLFDLTIIAYAFTGVVALWVFAMACLQWNGLKALRTTNK